MIMNLIINKEFKFFPKKKIGEKYEINSNLNSLLFEV